MAEKTTKDGKRKPRYNPTTKRIEWVAVEERGTETGTEAGTEAGTENRGSTANVGDKAIRGIWGFKNSAKTAGEEGRTATGTEAGTATGTEAGKENGTENGTEKKRRGRKPGASYTKGGTPLDKIDHAKLAKQLEGFHLIAATVTGNGILAIDEKQAQMLAASIMGIASQYEMSINPRTLAWIDLVATAGIIYGPKIFVILATKKQAPKPAPLQSADVFNLASYPKPPEKQ